MVIFMNEAMEDSTEGKSRKGKKEAQSEQRLLGEKNLRPKLPRILVGACALGEAKRCHSWRCIAARVLAWCDSRLVRQRVGTWLADAACEVVLSWQALSSQVVRVCFWRSS